MKILSSFIHPHVWLFQPWSYKIIHQNFKAVLFHSVKEHRYTSGPYDSCTILQAPLVLCNWVFFIECKIWTQIWEQCGVTAKISVCFSQQKKKICITSEALESSAQATLLWYTFIVIFCPFWCLTVSVHFHCMEKISLAPNFLRSTEERKPLWVWNNIK